MSEPQAFWPPFSLVLSTPRLTLRPVTDADIPEAIEAALSGIHKPGKNPFSHPWTEAPADQLPANTARHIWSTRAAATKENWCLQLGVWHGGEFLGSQDFQAKSFPALRTVTTGSWLKQSAQGRGFGKEMRAAVLLYAFDWLKAEVAESEAAAWNAPSLGVSRSLGYTDNGVFRQIWKDNEYTEVQYVRVTPDSFNRPDWQLRVEGHKATAEFLGLR